jgi:hypothetical protein
MLRQTLLFVAAVAIATPAFAHHGGGTFELNKTVSFPGAKLTKLEFLNPHGWLYFETTEKDGKVMKHRCEMRSAHVLRRSGWSPELFKSGEKVDITASPDRADVASCYLQTIVFANGTRMDRYGQYVKAPEGGVKEVRGAVKVVNTANRPARRPSGEPNITGDWAPEQVVMADPRGVGGGLVRLSTIPQDPAAAAAAAAAARAARAGGAGAPGGAPPRAGGAPGAGRGRGAGGPRMFNGAEVTELGEKAAAAFKPEDNPRFKCETTSIIFDWTFDGPVNRITQNKDTIVIQYGQLNLKRTVYMNMTTHPANVKLTRAGHSFGRWDGDTLVVDTVGFLPGVINGAIHHGSKMHVIERFTLDPKTWQLARTWELEDPEYLKGKAVGANPEVIMPADAEYTEDKCKEQKDLDYSKLTAKK